MTPNSIEHNSGVAFSRRGWLDHFCRRLWLAFTAVVWAAWWGGLSFYAIVVVPIGTEQIGSVEQGFITQQVTWWHNWVLLLFIGCLAIEALFTRSKFLGTLAVVLALVNVALFVDHAFLTRQMDVEHKSVPTAFYAQHAVYLWITAIEWFIGLGLCFRFCPSPILRLNAART